MIVLHGARTIFISTEEAIRLNVVLGLCVSREISPALMNVPCPPKQLYKELNAVCS